MAADLSIEQRVTRVEGAIDNVRGQVTSLSAHVDAFASGLNHKMDALAQAIATAQRANYPVMIAAGMFALALAGAMLFPVWLTTGNLKEGMVDLKAGIIKQHDDFKGDVNARFTRLDTKLQYEMSLQTESTRALVNEIDKRLQREMRLRDLAGKESVPVGD